MSKPTPGRGALAVGGVAAILASSCCLGPLVLVTLGFSGAWIGNLAVLEPYRPYLLAVAVVAMAFAWWRIFRPTVVCAPGDICATPPMRARYRVLFWIVALLVVIALGYPYLAPLFY